MQTVIIFIIINIIFYKISEYLTFEQKLQIFKELLEATKNSDFVSFFEQNKQEIVLKIQNLKTKKEIMDFLELLEKSFKEKF